jgi:hypothetical protein
MTPFGYTLMGEEHEPRDLVANARRAEEVRFDCLVASDHCHPWVLLAIDLMGSALQGAARPRGRPARTRGCPYLDAVDQFTGAGYDRVAFLQIGDDQDGFFRFWQDQLQPAVRHRR